MSEAQWIEWTFRNFGFPGLLLASHLYVIYRICRWVQPFVEDGVRSHITLIRQATGAFASMPAKEDLTMIGDSVLEIGKNVRELKVKVDSDGNMLAEVHRRVTKRRAEIDDRTESDA